MDAAPTAPAQEPWPSGLDVAWRIHDRVIQPLFAVSAVLESDGPLTREERARCRDELEHALAELRSALAPAAAGARTEGGSLREELQILRRKLGEVPLVVRPVEPRVPAELEPLAQHFVAEAVCNAVKHGHPTLVEVRVRAREGGLAIEVENDGVGAPRDGRTGLGLRLLAADARRQGGTVESGNIGSARWRTALRVPEEGSR